MNRDNLHNIQSTGYKTPDHYFDSLESVLLSKLKEDRLSVGAVSSGFKVPEGYFESLDAKLSNPTVKKGVPKTIPLFNWKRAAFVSGIAASVVLAFNIAFHHSEVLGFDDLETGSIERYLLDENLNAYDIAPYLGTMDLQTENFVETTINISDIEDYLLQNSDVEHLITD